MTFITKIGGVVVGVLLAVLLVGGGSSVASAQVFNGSVGSPASSCLIFNNNFGFNLRFAFTGLPQLTQYFGICVGYFCHLVCGILARTDD